jgi:SAM-dependent methyltransferase
VADYVRYRPGYPDELVRTLQVETGLNPNSVVADIGSGTGISTNLFLKLGCDVYAVEPNAEMRAACESLFAGQSRFHSINATAETTSLLKAYESLLLKFATDYEQINHTNIDAAVLARFFGGTHFETRSFPTSQEFDFAGLRGRLLSSSYAPAAGHPRHAPMLLELERLFREQESAGKVWFEYDTELYFGRLR